MPYVPVYEDMLDNPKLWALITEVGCTRREAIGSLVLMWHFALKHAPDGDLSRWDATVLARICDVPAREAQRWYAALRTTGWLDIDGHVHDWSEYGGRYVTKKEANRQRMAQQRAPASINGAHPDSEDGQGPAQARIWKLEYRGEQREPFRAPLEPDDDFDGMTEDEVFTAQMAWREANVHPMTSAEAQVRIATGQERVEQRKADQAKKHPPLPPSRPPPA